MVHNQIIHENPKLNKKRIRVLPHFELRFREEVVVGGGVSGG